MFKILKQELLFIPIMLLIVELFRGAITHFYPETALFDRGSEMETFLFRVWQISWITSASWLLLAVVFPDAFKTLTGFYKTFNALARDQREKFSMKLFLVFFFGLVLLLSGKAQNQTILRKQLTDTLNTQLNVREATGKNDGIEVEKYLHFVGRPKGDSWCAAFTSWNLNAVGITKPINPVNAWAPVFSNPKYVTWSQSLVKLHKAKDPKPGDCFTLFYSNLQRVGHVGFIVSESGNYFITVEGNTGLSGTREGAGVHKLKRAKDKIYASADYITPYLKSHEKNSNTAFSINRPYAGTQLCKLYTKDNSITYIDSSTANRQYALAKRFCMVQRFSIKDSGFANKDTSRCTRRYKWENQYACYSNRNGTLESLRINYKWKAYSGMYMQGFGNKGPAPTAFNSRPQNPDSLKQNRKGNRPNKGGPLYTRMG